MVLCVLVGCVVGNVVSQRRGPRRRTLQEEGELGQPTLTPAPSSHAHTLNSTPLSLSPSLPISLSILFVHRDEIWHMRFHQSARAGELAGQESSARKVVHACGGWDVWYGHARLAEAREVLRRTVVQNECVARWAACHGALAEGWS